jgi:hypothetical protein
LIISIETHDGDNLHEMINLAFGIPEMTDFDRAVSVANVFDRLLSTHMLGNLLVAAVLLVGAWWLRRRASES